MAASRSSSPNSWFTLLEGRAAFELGAMWAASPMLRAFGRGDRHPVLVLPGFTGDDRSTGPLRALLRAQGYWAHGWRLGQNLGPTTKIVSGLTARLEELHERHGMPVSLVGWSLGGIYARTLARQNPEMVRQVITLGSPFRMMNGDRSKASGMYDSLGHLHDKDALVFDVPESERAPLQMPATAIYTRTDGVVRWFHCIDEAGPMSENVEVIGSHSGLGFNPAVSWVVLDRLSQPVGSWRPFYPGPLIRHLYPLPANWQEARAAAAANA
nr:hypothetical protein [uncultured bacterium]